MNESWLKVYVYEPAREEIQDWPKEAKKDLGAILTKLQKGLKVGFPDTRAMGDVAPGVVEIRLRDASGIYRAFYLMRTELGILVFHSFKKKTQKTPRQEIETGQKRLKACLKELGI